MINYIFKRFKYKDKYGVYIAATFSYYDEIEGENIFSIKYENEDDFRSYKTAGELYIESFE